MDTFAGKVQVKWVPEAAVSSLGLMPYFIEFLKTSGVFGSGPTRRMPSTTNGRRLKRFCSPFSDFFPERRLAPDLPRTFSCDRSGILAATETSITQSLDSQLQVQYNLNTPGDVPIGDAALVEVGHTL